MSYKAYPSDLTDGEWQLIQPLLPAPSPIGHPREVDLREVVNVIFYMQREGAPECAISSTLRSPGEVYPVTFPLGKPFPTICATGNA